MIARRLLVRLLALIAILVLSASLAPSALAHWGLRTVRLPGPFQVAYVTRLESVSINSDFSILLKEGRAESLQAPRPGVFIGSYRNEILLTDPETDPANGLFKVRTTLTTRVGTIAMEAVVLVIQEARPFYGLIGWSRGTITGGTGVFEGATGSVEIAGRINSCDPAAEDFCVPVPLPINPDLGQREDFNFVIRGEIGGEIGEE